MAFRRGLTPFSGPAARTRRPPQAHREPTTGPRRTSALTPTSFTSDTNRLTKVTRQYDDWGNLTSERQEQGAGQNHYDQTVAYTFSYSANSNYLRPASVVYPTGSRTLTYGYGDSSAGTYTSAKVSDQVNRMDWLTWDGTRLTVFDFAANGRTDKRTYWKGTGANDTVATTAYSFDSFGRMTEIDATDTATGHIIDFRRDYDYNGNPKYTEYAHKPTRSELYGIQTGQSPEGPADALNRLTRYRRGTLDGNKTDLSATVFQQDWHDTQDALTLDKLGNWNSVRTDTDGTGNFTLEGKGHNLANEYTSKDGQAAYDHDDDGNLTDDGTYNFAYDSANHLVRVVRKSDTAVIGEYLYDALGRRVKKVITNSGHLNGTTLFYYDGLRVLEQGHLDGNQTYQATHQFIWGLYLDELLLYDYDADADGDFDAVDQTNGDARYYALQDFVYSTVALIGSASAVQERYDYSAYGAPTFWDAAYTNTLQGTGCHNDVLFTGQRYEPETHIYHYKGRSLHPTLGHFLQRDPVGIDPQPYKYCRAAPLNAADPSGLWTDVSLVTTGSNVAVSFTYGSGLLGLIDSTGTISLGTYGRSESGVALIVTPTGSVSFLFADYFLRQYAAAFSGSQGITRIIDQGADVDFGTAWLDFVRRFNAAQDCGPDVTAQLVLVLRLIDSGFKTLSPADQARACCTPFTLNAATYRAWDITELYGHGLGLAPGLPGATVAVAGKCYDSGAVNYVMYGKMAKLCGKGFSDAWDLVKEWKLNAYGIEPDMETRGWAIAGFNGWDCVLGGPSPVCNMQVTSMMPYRVLPNHPVMRGQSFSFTWLPFWKAS
jgi:RHS repeat-associated protein